ncbi:MAG: transcription-repair coupling factor [Lachnospiraceae bacterium]|nr:transcription-repair coupling factor [Lachnospiraceae bacterium]
MASFASPLNELNEYRILEEDFQKQRGPLSVSGCMDSQKVHLMHELAKGKGVALVVTYSEARSREIYEDFQNFRRDVLLYPARDLLFYQADIQGNLLTRQRAVVLKALFEGEAGVVVTTVDACMERLVPMNAWKERRLWVEEGAELDVEELRNELVLNGYERVIQVEQPGQFCIRGGIVDVYPLTEENPVRIELWDTEIDSIRTFDVESQRSIERVEGLYLYPASEMFFTGEQLEKGIERIRTSAEQQSKALNRQGKGEASLKIRKQAEAAIEAIEENWRITGLDSYRTCFYEDTQTLMEYFPENTAVFVDEPVRVIEKAEVTHTEFAESMAQRLEKGYMIPEQAEIMTELPEVFVRMQTGRSVFLSGIEQKMSGLTAARSYSLTVKNANTYQNGFDLLIQDLKRWKKNGFRIVLLCPSRTRAERMARELQEYELLSYYTEDEDKEVQPGEICVMYGNLHRGFEYPLIKFVVIAESDLFGKERKKRKRKKYGKDGSGQKIKDFTDLNIGDYVIHENHGLGIYRGIEKIEVDHIIKDYIKVEYKNGGNLYLPVTQLDVLQKYAGADIKKPKLNTLGGTDWEKTRTRVKKAVENIARDLVELYAARQEQEGFQYGEDTVWQREFEELFPYEPTEDQEHAISAVKADMESNKIMDRLICGDVGYGKTEIAIRAAFKAVQEGKQVVYLVPTTILAQQHYNTFTQRMMEFPVRVDMMSRFKSAAEQRKTLEDLRKGIVDIVIGTHRVLSDDVKFKDLGLLIIDEEQRFGVAHKEKIKKLKTNVDVLTLTATPIPRTLHMSLVGIRDMSILQEPPMDRMAIQTYVMEYNEEMVREAIEREMMRGGQVFYVYNKVSSIDEITARIAKLVPGANVVFAHGQMKERQLENIMVDFINGDIDVLVSTTIIETGLDIPNVNTIIIHEAENFGLSQLYQLRGRVGRSSRNAYAFMMYKPNHLLREEAEKRLSAIREFTELGSGVRIAMKDLEIRGAGNVLGAEQSGHMEAVGYELYCKMLNESVRMLKGEPVQESFETAVEMDMDAYIPGSYIRNEAQKLDVYKRIALIETEEEFGDMQDELTDRFGDLPKPVENLLWAALLKAMGHEAGVTEVRANRAEIRLTMNPKAPIDTAKIPGLIGEYQGALKLVPGERPYFLFVDRKKQMKEVQGMLETVKELVGKVKTLRAEPG